VGGRGSRRKFGDDDKDLLTILSHRAVAISNARCSARRRAESRLVRGMMALIESRDGYAKGAPSAWSGMSAPWRGCSTTRRSIEVAGLRRLLREHRHDHGERVDLEESRALSEEEWALIKQHPLRAPDPRGDELSKEVIAIVLNHHERWVARLSERNPRTGDSAGRRIVPSRRLRAMTSERPYPARCPTRRRGRSSRRTGGARSIRA